jgi:hypothetical protein
MRIYVTPETSWNCVTDNGRYTMKLSSFVGMLNVLVTSQLSKVRRY